MNKGRGLFLAYLILGASRLWADSPEELDIEGLGVSPGRGISVIAPLTFDPAKARSGGFIYIPADQENRDDQAVRMSEGLLLWGRFAPVLVYGARAHHTPALLLSQSRLSGGPSLAIEIPIYGPAKRSTEGYLYQMAEKSSLRLIKEGDVVRLDALKGLVHGYSPVAGHEELELFRALRAYDGLRDIQSLIQWYEARSLENFSSSRLGLRLLEELAPRLGIGIARAEDYTRAKKVVEKRLPDPDIARLRGLERRLYLEQEKNYSAGAAALNQALGEAGSLPAAERLEREAGAAWKRLEEAARALDFGQSARRLEGVHRALEKLASRRIEELKAKKALSWEEALSATGAATFQRVSFSGDYYLRFAAESGLSSPIEDIAQDASLDLSRKSARIQELLTSRKIAPDSPLGREILGRVPSSPFYQVSGAGPDALRVGRDGLVSAIQEAWASYWAPGPLGRRKREGLPTQPWAEVSVSPREPSEVSGILFTRDPSSGSRERMLVLGVRGEWAGGALADEYLVEAGTGREALPPFLASDPCLSQERLAALARAARALENHFGCGLELEYSFSQGRLLLGLKKACDEEGGGKGGQ